MDDFERLYQERQARGQVGWHSGDYEHFEMQPFLEQMVSRCGLDPSRSSVLDLGCGSGETSLFLASLGFSVCAVDISPTAIGTGRQAASRRHLAVDFRVGDVCRDPLPTGGYDVVIDGQLLHCIVGWPERAALLAAVHTALKPGGEFWSNTMVGRPRVSRAVGWRLDQDGVFWKIDPTATGSPEAFGLGGEVWLPVRRIQPSTDALVSEVTSAGFRLLWHEIKRPVHDTDVEMLSSRWRVDRVF